MNWYRIYAVVTKEFREILRDRIYSALAIFLPAILILVFGYGLAPDIEKVPITIVDYDHTTASRDYAYHFIASRYFKFEGYSNSLEVANDQLVSGKVQIALVIPENFQKKLQQNETAHVQSILDGTSTLVARTLTSYLVTINTAASAQFQIRYLTRKLAISEDKAMVILNPLQVKSRYLYNQEFKGIWSLGPSLIMFV